MSACALFIIGMTTPPARSPRATGGSGIGGGAGFRQPPNTRAATSRDALDARRRRRRRPSARSARSARRAGATSWSRVRLSTISIDALRPPAVRMAVRVQQRHQRFDRADGRVVLVLADRGDRPRPCASRARPRAATAPSTMSPSSASTGSKSSARQVQTSENRCRVTLIVSVMPRLSSSSAISAADRVAVPRSITRESSHVAPGGVGRIARSSRRASPG